MTKYWTYQLAGWMGYSAIGIGINLLKSRESVWPLLVGHVVMISAGIGLTHLLRRELHRRRASGRVWPLLTVSSFGISAILASLVIGTNRILTGNRWELLAAVALWWGMFLAVGVWVILYLRFSDQRRHAAREEHLQLALRDAQLRALESQMNPHFLFNALNSIRALVEIDPARAQEMLTRLANVLRSRLRRDEDHTVPLRNEIETVSDYLALETVRFSDRLESAVRLDEEAAGCRIPPMVLQTLVENAIKHGISQTRGPGRLLIQASIEDQMLLLAVENTGELRGSTSEQAQLGLKNIRERLQLLYGGRASLRLDGDGGSVRATVAIPVVA